MNRGQFLAINLVIASFLLIPFGYTGAVKTTESVNDIESHIHFVAIADSPRAQFLDNVSIQAVKCAEGLELIMKISNGMPACVNPSSVSILIERGWGVHVLPDYEKSENNNSEYFAVEDLAITTENVIYFEDYEGFLAHPQTSGDYPGVILIHEWWGLNDNIE